MEKKYNISDAIQEAISFASSKKRKFTESFEIIINLNIDKKDKPLSSGSIELPNNMTKEKKVAIFAQNGSDEFKAAKDSGADFVGMDDLVMDISKKKVLYDVYLAAPSAMDKIKKVAPVLGARNKMPTSKLGTLLENPESLVSKVKNKIVFFKIPKNNIGCVQTIFGDLGMEINSLTENASCIIKAIVDQFKTLNPTKDALRSIYIKTTMGESFEVDAKTFA